MAETNYFWDDLEDNVVEEYNDSGVTTVDYTTEPGRFGNVISQRIDNQSRYFHQGNRVSAERFNCCMS